MPATRQTRDLRVLGVDPGSIRCGYGVLDVRGCVVTYVECGVLEANRRSPLARRLVEVEAGLAEVVEELRPPEGVEYVAAVESVWMPRKGQRGSVPSAIALAHSRGVVLLVAARAGLPVAEYTAAEVKRSATRRGNASKAQVSAGVRAVLGLRSTPSEDATDALAVALTHATCGR